MLVIKKILKWFFIILASLFLLFFIFLANGASFYSLEEAEAEALDVVKQALAKKDLLPGNLSKKETIYPPRQDLISFYGVAWAFEWDYRDSEINLEISADIISDGFVTVSVSSPICTLYEMDRLEHSYSPERIAKECELSYNYEGYPDWSE